MSASVQPKPYMSRIVSGSVPIANRRVTADTGPSSRLPGGLSTSCAKALANFGPDALDPSGFEPLARAARRRRIPIKCLLLDQSVIAGIGNI